MHHQINVPFLVNSFFAYVYAMQIEEIWTIDV